MQSESTSNTDSGRFFDRFRGTPATSDDPIVAGRLDWVTTVPRDQLADLATRSRTLAGSARTRVPPMSELSSRRFGRGRQEPVQPESTESSTRWMLIAIVAALVSVVVFVAVRRSQQRAEDEMIFDAMTESDMLRPEHQSMPIDDGYDSVVSPGP